MSFQSPYLTEEISPNSDGISGNTKAFNQNEIKYHSDTYKEPTWF